MITDYIQRNKEWIFSGVGIAIIGAIYALVRKMVLNKLKKDPKPFKDPLSVAQHAIEKIPSPARGLTVEGITDEINSAPPFQKDAIAENFKGIFVKWEGTFYDIEKAWGRKSEGTDAAVEVRTGESLYSIRFMVAVDKYPQLKVLRRGDRIGVSGTIKACSGPGLYVEIDVTEITFPK
jgi:hypothetical protein